MVKSKQVDKIVRIRISDERSILFGNSYKPWEMQLEEYLFMLKRNNNLGELLEVTISDNGWIGWGGLKWCPENDFQNQLNREGCQSSDENNPNPRIYEQMAFYKDSSTTKKVKKMFENLYSNIY